MSVMRHGLALIEVLAACTVLGAGLLLVARLTGEAARLATAARDDARAIHRADSVIADAALRACDDSATRSAIATLTVDRERRLRTVRVTIPPTTVIEAVVPCRP